MHFPFLPADEFFAREHFPWIESIEAQTDVIRAELEALLAEDASAIRPYVAMEPGTPANKLATLRESIREESTQGLDQKQEQHDKETLLSQRLKNDAQIAATTGLLTDRVSQKNAESLRASLMVTPVENLLPADIKADTLIKGAVNSFLSPTATAQESS